MTDVSAHMYEHFTLSAVTLSTRTDKYTFGAVVEMTFVYA